MSNFRSRTPALLMAICLAFAVQSQNNVDVGLYQNGDQLEVRVRPQADFNGIFSSIVFTISWPRNSNAQLGELVQAEKPSTYIPLQRSGAVRQDADRNYQVFAGFGLTDLNAAGQPWHAGEEYIIATIPYTGAAEFHLTQNEWTRRTESNADYYVSLGGEDRTGDIYKSMAGDAGDHVELSITPNPNRGQFVIVMPVHAEDDLWFELVNSAGQIVVQEKPNAAETAYRKDMDLSSAGAGVYHLRIHRNGSIETHRIVVN